MQCVILILRQTSTDLEFNEFGMSHPIVERNHRIAISVIDPLINVGVKSTMIDGRIRDDRYLEKTNRQTHR